MGMHHSPSYPTNVSDPQWQLLEPLIPKPKKTGRPPSDPRLMLNAIFYVLRGGIAWRLLPVDFGPWGTVYHTFRRWTKLGVFEQIHFVLHAIVRAEDGRATDPSAAIMDSQSVKTSRQAGPRGNDAAKKIRGRKRHLLVDTLGLLILVRVTPADVQDRDGARILLPNLRRCFFRLRRIWADKGYRGSLIAWVHQLRRRCRLFLDIVQGKKQKGFHVQPKRWIVERTNAWFSNFRRLSRDYEQRTYHSEAFIYLAFVSIMLNRLCPQK